MHSVTLCYIHILWVVPGRAACRRCGAGFGSGRSKWWMSPPLRRGRSKWCSTPSILSIEQTWRQDFLSNKVAYSVTRNTKHKSRQKKRAHIITPTENQESLHWRMSSTMWASCGSLEADRTVSSLCFYQHHVRFRSPHHVGTCLFEDWGHIGPTLSMRLRLRLVLPTKNRSWRSRHTPVIPSGWGIKFMDSKSKLVKSAILSTRHSIGPPTRAGNSRILHASEPAVQETRPAWWSQWLWWRLRLW